ncbi:AMP-binding protein [Nocardioides sp.]|uniref:AMP-binding protein n=1 Tax=Nocardioides sp. TaxID=35761 RepID=UPI003D0FD487
MLHVPPSGIWHQLDQLVAQDPDRLTLTFGTAPGWSRAALRTGALGVAAGLEAAGVRPGDRVLVMVGNRPEIVLTWLACLRIGAVLVPVNTSMRGDILRHMVQVAEPSLVVVEKGLWPQLRLELAQTSASDARIVLVDGVGDEDGNNVTGWPSLNRPITTTSHELTPSQPAAILFTSGTTGPSKGVVWTERAVLSLARGAHLVAEYNDDDIVYVTLPLFHANGLFVTLLPALMVGAHTIVDERFSASAFWHRVRHTGATVTSMLGIMAPVLVGRPSQGDDRDHALSRALVVPAPLDPETFTARFGAKVRTFYALTDVGMPIGVVAGEPFPPGSCGRALPDWECQVVDEHDEPVSPGVQGELVVRPRSPWTTSLGYWGNPDATVAAWQNLWLHTADLVVQDREGWFYFRDRSKDAIRRSGENVSSFEVEAVLEAHPNVGEAAVFAVASALAEDEVMACVVAADGAAIDVDALARHCRQRLPYFAVPRYLEVRDHLPRTSSQKVLKAELRAAGVTAATVDLGRALRTDIVVEIDGVAG